MSTGRICARGRTPPVLSELDGFSVHRKPVPQKVAASETKLMASAALTNVRRLIVIKESRLVSLRL